MKNSRTLIVAPYSGIENTINDIVKANNIQDIDTVTGDLEHGLEVAFDKIQSGKYDLIISRGGTADLLINETNIPILEIPITTTDIMHAMKLTEKFEGEWAIIGFNSIISKAEEVCKLMGWSPKIYPIKDKEEVVTVVNSLKEEGIELIVGDVITTNYCNQIGLNSILISSSKDSIESALSQSTHLKHSINSSKLLYKTCYKHHKDDKEFSMIYNHTGNLTMTSIKNEKIPQSVIEQIESKKTMFYLYDHFQHDFRNNLDLISINSNKITIENKQYILLIVKINNLYSLDIEGFKLYDKGLLEDIHGSINLNFFGSLRNEITQSSNTAYPVILRGDRHTGKSACVNYLFTTGEYQNNLLYVFDLSVLSLESYNKVSSYISLSSLSDCVIYFKNLHKCDENLLGVINNFINNQDKSNNLQIFFSCNNNISEDSESVSKLESFTELDNFAVINIPMLKDRENELNNILTLFISEFNISLGTNIISITDEAFDLIKQYNWPGNIKQLRRVLRKSMEESNDYYIDEKTFKKVLCEENQYGYNQYSMTNENENRTLDEIIFEVVNNTLQANNFNQTKTAEILGISRTTVWRVLKDGDK